MMNESGYPVYVKILIWHVANGTRSRQGWVAESEKFSITQPLATKVDAIKEQLYPCRRHP